MVNFFEIVVLTASESDYADIILDFIESNNKYFAHRIYKDQCIVKEDFYLFKNLNVLTYNRNLKDIVIVDNSVKNFALFICNGLPIVEFTGSETDQELCKITNYLLQLAKEDNFTNVIKHDIIRFLLNNP